MQQTRSLAVQRDRVTAVWISMGHMLLGCDILWTLQVYPQPL